MKHSISAHAHLLFDFINVLTAVSVLFTGSILAQTNFGSGPRDVSWDPQAKHLPRVGNYESLDSGLVASYSFTGNANDESSNGNNGTVNGATLTTDRFENTNSAYSFNGTTNSIVVNDANSLDMTGGITISVWIYSLSTAGSMILGKSDYQTTTNYILRYATNGNLQWEYNLYNETNSNTITLNEWHHIVVTATDPNGVRKIYINDSLVSTQDVTSSGTHGTVGNDLTIGAASHMVFPEFFSGKIDDVRLYSRVLSQTEIDSLYHLGGWDTVRSISGTKFNDLNGNGSRDGGEPGLASWRIRLFKNASQTDSTLTNGSGDYTFSNLSNGTYAVREKLETNWEQTTPLSGEHSGLVIASGTVITGKDFGNFQLGSISGTKFNDLNGNGSRDGGDPGVSSWRIRLFKNASQTDSTLTSGSGDYTFSNLSSGTYAVREKLETNWEQTTPLSGEHSGLVIASGTVITGKDFGNRRTTIIRFIDAGWNLISNPFIVANDVVSFLFPTSTSNAFAYQGSYVTVDSVKNGNGYWLKFPTSDYINFSGGPIYAETIGVKKRWNIIGTISSPIPVTSITSLPPGIVTSNFYGYSGTYIVADTIHPGAGYWVKVTQDGSIILSTDPSAIPSNRIRIVATSEMPPSSPQTGLAKGDDIPESFALEQNYPNPFNPSTIIRYSLPVDVNVTLKIFNLLGQEVVTLLDHYQKAGRHEAFWTVTEELGTGVYYVRLEAGPFVETKKLILLR